MVSFRMPCQALLLALLVVPFTHAQLSDVPELSTATQATELSSTGTSSGATSTTGSSTGATTTAASTDASTTGSAASTSTGTSSSGFSLSNAPTIAGAGIPTIGVPYTAAAPFMQKSSMPEGTVFIIVGAILAFFGACILLWRGIVAWSINRSVKRTADASTRGSEKNSSAWGGSSYKPVKGGSAPYKDSTWAGSSMSLDALTSQGKPINPFKDPEARQSTPPQGLFFSPTAEARQSVSGLSSNNIRDSTHSNLNMGGNRASTYLPAGYYASPSAQAAGGEQRMTVGGSVAPYARNSRFNPSPPTTPGHAPSSRISTGGARQSSRDGLRPPGSRDGIGAGSARSSYAERSSYVDTHRSSYAQRVGGSGAPQRDLHTQPSSSSLAINRPGSEGGLSGSRAPSQAFDELMDHHGNGPRERF